MFKINVSYGVDVAPKTSDSPITVGALRRDSNLKACLGYGDNVNFLVNGVAMPDEAIIANGTTVTVETRANSKAN